MKCLFCEISNKNIESLVLYEDDLIMIILDAFPDCDGHTLIIPKNHYETFKDIPDDLLKHIYKYAKIYTDILLEKLNKKALTLAINYGDAQVIKHFHLHLLPDYKSKAVMDRKKVYEIITGENL